MYIGGGNMFPHTSKRPFSGFSAEIGWISSKEKSASTFPNWSKPSIFSLFQPFLRLSNTTVSTCVDWTQGTGLPIRGAVREGHIDHIPNTTVQLAIMTHIDNVGG